MTSKSTARKQVAEMKIRNYGRNPIINPAFSKE